jgi:hypothetical protein
MEGDFTNYGVVGVIEIYRQRSWHWATVLLKRTQNKGCPRAAFLQSNAITASGSHISPAAKGRNPKEAAMPGAAC